MVMVVTRTTIPVTELGPPLGAVRNTELSHYTQLIIVWLPEVKVFAVIVLDLDIIDGCHSDGIGTVFIQTHQVI